MNTRKRPTLSWCRFPPLTLEVQYDEKWSFVNTKEKNLPPDEGVASGLGDRWDHVAFDPEHKLVLEVVVGRRTQENTEALVAQTKARLPKRPDILHTTDAHHPYLEAIEKAYAEKSGKNKGKVPEQLVYGTVLKRKEKGRVVEVKLTVVLGTILTALAYLDRSTVSEWLNTSFVERQNATDRHRNARKVRKTYCFSKKVDVHDAATYFTMYSYNFCWPVRTLSAAHEPPRSPAMAAKLTDHVWSLHEWLSLPVRPPKSE